MKTVQAGDSRAIQRLMLQVAGTMFLQSYRAGKYYNYDRDGDKIAIDLILNSGNNDCSNERNNNKNLPSPLC
jgi:hypothetical protein